MQDKEKQNDEKRNNDGFFGIIDELLFSSSGRS